jgi:hypothetical protein
MNRRLIAVNGLAAVVLAGTAALVVANHDDPDPARPRGGGSSATPPATGTSTSAGARPGTPGPGAAAQTTPAGRASRVSRLPGPVDDRVELTGLAFDGRAVTGSVRLRGGSGQVQLLAGFYSADGSFLDDVRISEPAGTGPTAFRIAVPAGLRGKAATAAVGVPGLG